MSPEEREYRIQQSQRYKAEVDAAIPLELERIRAQSRRHREEVVAKFGNKEEMDDFTRQQVEMIERFTDQLEEQAIAAAEENARTQKEMLDKFWLRDHGI